MTELWQRYAADFFAMTDAEIAEESEQAQRLIEEQEEWLEAVVSWEAAGKPRVLPNQGTHND